MTVFGSKVLKAYVILMWSGPVTGVSPPPPPNFCFIISKLHTYMYEKNNVVKYYIWP